MTKISEKNLLEFIVAFFIAIGCDEGAVRAFFTARRFAQGVVFNLPAVCIIGSNKPTLSKSNQSHIHVTSKSCDFFFPRTRIASVTSSTDWEKQGLKISNNNINALLKTGVSNSLDITDSYMMMKIECRQSQEKQVQLSKIKNGDDDKFLLLRKGLFENDLLVFLKFRNTDQLFVAGIPESFYKGVYEFESIKRSNASKPFKSEVYSSLESKNAIPIKAAVESVMAEHSSDEVIESDDALSDAVYQSLVDSAEASLTAFAPEPYINPTSENTIRSNRPSTNPAIGKEAIKDNSFKCAIDGSHITFLKPDGTSYMEVHHLIPLNSQKDFSNKLDTKANIIPVCPNCHRMLHYGRIEDIEPILKTLYDEREISLKLSGIEVSYDNLRDCYL